MKAINKIDSQKENIMAEITQLGARYLRAKRKLFDTYYSELNAPQREAVFTANGALLVLAGAGSGKTTVLVKRIVFLVKYGNAYYSDYIPQSLTEQKVAQLERAAGESRELIEEILPEFISAPCAPWQMLAITFTNKAANEIKSRLVAAMDDDESAKSIWAGTFHSICMRILRSYGDRLGYSQGFAIYDANDTKSAISSVMKSLNIDEKALPIKSVINEISRSKDALMTPDDYELEYGLKDFRRKQIARVYRAYQEHLKNSNALDFDDIIMQTVFLLRDNKDIKEYYQNKFRYVSVDEFQDTNQAQFVLTSLLCGGYRNIMVVGDDDQSIYRFRGAVIENILGFDRKYKDAKIIKLEQNYRSTDVILDAANAIIAKNVGRKGKNLWTERKGGSKITLKLCEEQNSEARYLVDKIQSLVSSNQYSFRDCAILYRTNAQSSVIERTFAKSGVPYRMLGGLRFNDRKEIRDIVAYLQFIVNPADSERMKRIINEPKRGIGATTVDGVLAIAREKEISVFEVMRNADSYVALSRSASKLKAFAEMIASLRKLLASDISLEAFVNQVLDRSGYRQMLIDAGEEEKERVENIEEFVSGVIEYERSNEEPTLIGFLEENALVSDVDKYDETADAVVMMTVHSAKGLEFPVVFLPGMEDGLFPGMQTIMADPSEMEEERRLAYVAITRAKDSVYIIHTKNRMLYGRTSCNPISRFVTEIPTRLINEELAYAPRTDNRPRTYFSSSGDSYGGYSQRSRTEKSPFAQEPKPAPSRQGLDFKEGDRVYHVTFGPGEILSARPMGADVLYEVVFDKVGTKKLMGTYAKLKKLL